MSALVWQIIYQSGPDKINLNRPLVFMFFGGGEEKPKQTVQLEASGTSCVSCSGHRGQQWAGGRVQRDTKKSLQPKGCKHPGQKYFQWLRDFFFIFTKTCSISAYSCWTARTVESTLCVRTDSRGRRCSPTPWTGRAAGRAAAAGSRWCSAGWTPSGAPSASRSPSSLGASPPCRPGLGFVG